MADEFVLDASVAAKCFFTEDGSDEARALVYSGVPVCRPGPDLRRNGEPRLPQTLFAAAWCSQALAAEALDGLAELLDETAQR